MARSTALYQNVGDSDPRLMEGHVSICDFKNDFAALWLVFQMPFVRHGTTTER